MNKPSRVNNYTNYSNILKFVKLIFIVTFKKKMFIKKKPYILVILAMMYLFSIYKLCTYCIDSTFLLVKIFKFKMIL